jgi:heme exporter protein CcmD
MPHAWNYVGAGYGVATVALATYVVWMLRRTRRLRRALDAHTDG